MKDLNTMYISTGEYLSIDIEELNRTTDTEITWSRGYQEEGEVVKINFEIDTQQETFSLTSSFQRLQSEIQEETDFFLTGVKYNISSHEGELVFSKLGHIQPNTRIGELLSTNPDSLTISKTVALDDVVTCTGSFISMFDWGYTAAELKVRHKDGLYITVIPDEHSGPTITNHYQNTVPHPETQ